jgi:HSP20 family protein
MSIVKTKNGESNFPTLFSDFFNSDPFFRPGWLGMLDRELENTMPAVNIKENEKSFSIELAAPGFTKKDFHIDVDEDILTISAEKKMEKKEDKERYTRREYSYETFSRSFTLPKNSISDGLEAKYEEGILRLMVPKKVEAKAKAKKEVLVS